jgi:hypothetical protein
MIKIMYTDRHPNHRAHYIEPIICLPLPSVTHGLEAFNKVLVRVRPEGLIADIGMMKNVSSLLVKLSDRVGKKC